VPRSGAKATISPGSCGGPILQGQPTGGREGSSTQAAGREPRPPSPRDGDAFARRAYCHPTQGGRGVAGQTPRPPSPRRAHSMPLEPEIANWSSIGWLDAIGPYSMRPTRATPTTRSPSTNFPQAARDRGQQKAGTGERLPGGHSAKRGGRDQSGRREAFSRKHDAIGRRNTAPSGTPERREPCGHNALQEYGRRDPELPVARGVSS